MDTGASKGKSRKSRQPFEVIQEGSISLPIYAHTNIIPHRHPHTGAMVYETLSDGKLKARIKYQTDIYTVAYYAGTKRAREFSDLAKARREAEMMAIKPANGETEAIKLSGGDRAAP